MSQFCNKIMTSGFLSLAERHGFQPLDAMFNIVLIMSGTFYASVAWGTFLLVASILFGLFLLV